MEALWGLPSHSKEAGSIEPDASLGAPSADLIEFSVDGSKIVLIDTQKGFVIRDTET